MKDSLFIKSRLNDLKSMIIPQAVEYTQPHYAKIKILSWVYNDGKIKSEKEVQMKLERKNEELLGLENFDKQNIIYKCAIAEKQELENILK